MSIDPWPRPDVEARVRRSMAVADACASEFDTWFARRSEQPEYAVFSAHFTILHGVLRAMVAAIHDRLTALADDPDGEPATVYVRCRDIDRRADVVRQLFHWYRDKYDQRTDAVRGATVRAADAVVRSCWTQPFAVAEVPRPSGPLTYLDHRYDAAACPRGSVPTPLRSTGADDVIGPFLAELPIPVLALPAVSVLEPWWLVLAAHETGHLVQQDLDEGLDKATRAAVGAAVGAAPGPLPETAEHWPDWSRELFADAFAVLSVGTAALPAVADLEYGPPASLVRYPGSDDRYPPPAVRLALHGELARAAGIDLPGPGAADVAAWVEALPPGSVQPVAVAEVRAHLRLVPAVAAALVALKVNGSSLPQLCGFAAARFRPGGEVSAWRHQLTLMHGFLPSRNSPTAARSGIAAAVPLWTGPDARPDAATLALAQRNLLLLLDGSGPPGTLADPVRPGRQDVDLAELAQRHASLLFQVDVPVGG